MTCPVCFFTEAHQRRLKKPNGRFLRFEERLASYCENFIAGVHEMGTLEQCQCSEIYCEIAMYEWTESLLTNLQSRSELVRESFSALIDVYCTFLSQHAAVARMKLWDHLQQNYLAKSQASKMDFFRLLYRARNRSELKTDNPREFFHIPFSNRHIAGNKRFSMNSQPMLYFANSVLAVSKELDREVADLAIAGFVPDFFAHAKTKVFSLTNHLDDTIRLALPGIFSTGSKLSYDENNYSPSETTIEQDIHQTILRNICTMPVETRGNFIPEYVIPQLLTGAVQQNGFQGILFPSTRDYSDLTGHHSFSRHHVNLGLFVPDDPVNDTNEELLSSFDVYTPSTSESYNVSLSDILSEIEDVLEYNNSVKQENGIPILQLVNFKLALEYLKGAKYAGKDYFMTEFGIAELALGQQWLHNIKQLLN